MRGFIDGVVDGHVFGWVIDEDEPTLRLRVAATLDGVPLPRVDAFGLRDDLRRAGIGDGSSGFRIPLVNPRLEPGFHELEVIVEATGESLLFAGDWVVLDGHGRPIPGVELGSPGQAPLRQPTPATEAPAAIAPDEAAPTGGDVAVLGEAGWLFALPARSRRRRLLGLERPTYAELDALVAGVERVHRDARAVGATALVACVPDKLHVYRERLPAGLSASPHGRLARLAAACLRDSDDGDLVDLIGPLSDARIHGRVFTRTGRSLTWTGAFHAYRSIARALGGRLPGLAPMAAAGLDLGELEAVADSLEHTALTIWTGGDLVEVDGAGRSRAPDREAALGGGTPLLAGDAGGSPGAELWERRDRPELPSAVIVTSADGRRIARLLVEHFSRAMIVEAATVDPEVLRERQPDALIQLASDRSLSALRG